MTRLLHSAKFWTAMVDVFISMVLYFTAKYVPGAAADIKFVIAAIQPVFLIVIGGIFAEDAAAKAAGLAPKF